MSLYHHSHFKAFTVEHLPMSSGTPSEVSDISFSDADSFQVTDIGINEEPVNAQQVPDISLSEADKHNGMDDLPLRKLRHEKYYHSDDMIEFMVSLFKFMIAYELPK